MEEQVDIVDDQDNMLYQTSKVDAHTKGLLHRTVIGGVRTSDGKIMLVRQNPDRQDGGQYVSPVGGHVAAGETEDQALIREAEEELGYTDIKYQLVGKAIFNRFVKNRQENHFFIVYEILTDEEPKQLGECDDFQYFTEQQLKSELQENSSKFGAAYMFVVEQFYPQLLK